MRYSTERDEGIKPEKGHNSALREEITTIDLIDKLVYCTQALAEACLFAKEMADNTISESRHICSSLSMSCLNSNFDHRRIKEAIEQTLDYRRAIAKKYKGYEEKSAFPPVDDPVWLGYDLESRVIEGDDIEWYALKEYLLWTLKGLACYSRQASHLGYEEIEHYQHLEESLMALHKEQDSGTLWGYIEATGKLGLKVLQLLDAAKTTQFGASELTLVSTVTGKHPGILVCGEDLKDLEQILIQSEGKSIDIYTHDAQLAAHSYPEFKKYNHLVGNYGLSWFRQEEDFKQFNGAILLTTGPLMPSEGSLVYDDRIFTTGVIGNTEWATLNEKLPNGAKNFSKIIALAQELNAPTAIKQKEQTIGFGHIQNQSIIPRMVHALKHQLIDSIIIINGSDAPFDEYDYYNKVIEKSSKNSVILTAGSIKYRFNQKEYGNVAGIPRLLDAGQNSDIYSWVVFLNKIAAQMGYEDVKSLPVQVYSSLYDQKSLLTHISLLTVGFKATELGPVHPAFVTTEMEQYLKEHFNCTVVKNH